MKQLTALDATFLYMETPYSYGHVSSVSIYARPEPGYEAYDALRSTIQERLGVLEPLRRRLLRDPLDLDLPHWIIDDAFDLDFHVRHLGLPPPGDFRQLQTQVARLAARPLDQSRPLWEAYVIDGLPDDRFALFMKMHHATVDGAAGAEMLGLITDTSPGAERPELQVPLSPADREPSSIELLTRSSMSMLFEPARMVRFQARMVKDLVDSSRNHGAKSVLDAASRAVPGPIGSAVRKWATDVDDETPLIPPTAAPPTPFNQSIGPHRRFEARTAALTDVKAIKSAAGATVNDVVMAVCAGALRTWLAEKEELPTDPLVSMIPVSIRTGEESDPWTNRVSAIFATIPTHLDEPLDRLRGVQAAMTKGKEQFEMMPADMLSELSQMAPPAFAIRASRLASRFRLGGRVSFPFNLVISNVPGPRQPLYLDRAELEHYYPVSTLIEGQGLNITVQSYLDSLDFGLVACADLVPDLERLADLLLEEIDVLAAAAAAAS